MRKVSKLIVKVFAQVLLYAVILVSLAVCLRRIYKTVVWVNNEFFGEDYFIPMDHFEVLIRKNISGWIFPVRRMDRVGLGVICDGDIEHIEYDTVKMGRYPQSRDGEEPIEWLIIDEKLGRTLLLSKYCLDAVPYDNKIDNIVAPLPA